MIDFIIDGTFVITYKSFIRDLNERNYYYPVYRSPDLYSYCLNLCYALINNKPITLIDSDINETELNSLGLANQVDKKELLESNISYKSIDVILNSISKSGSLITIFTSGTTGQPKKITHTIENLTRSVKKGDKFSNQVWAFAYNPTHMAGIQVLLQAILNINTIVNVFNKNRNYTLDSIEKHNITHISATPTFYRLLMPAERVFKSVQRVTLGGEKSDNNLHSNILTLFPDAKITNIYASTEAGSLFASKGEFFELPKSLGDLIKVVDNEILIHQSLLGKSGSLSLANEYYPTGDLIEWIEEEKGLFKFKSRKNELINVGGYKVNPTEVEDVINSLDGVLQCIVYSKSNSVLGNILCCDIKSIVPDLTELSIRRYLSEKLQDFKIPRKIKFVDEISLTRTGKIKRI